MTPRSDKVACPPPRPFHVAAGGSSARRDGGLASPRADGTRWVGARAFAVVVRRDVTLWCDLGPCFSGALLGRVLVLVVMIPVLVSA